MKEIYDIHEISDIMTLINLGYGSKDLIFYHKSRSKYYDNNKYQACIVNKKFTEWCYVGYYDGKRKWDSYARMGKPNSSKILTSLMEVLHE